MTLDSVIQLDSGMRVMVSEFFNEDDPDVDHSLGQKVAITWVESWVCSYIAHSYHFSG